MFLIQHEHYLRPVDDPNKGLLPAFFILTTQPEEVMKTTANQEKVEHRSAGEIRATTDDGIIEAYLTKFGTVDEYRSTFTPGSFKKTFQERGEKIKMLWDHDNLIGHVIECREDGYGPWIKGQINMETNAGREAFAHLKAGDVDAMSFGFSVVQDKIEDDIRVISEVRCMEVSPVIFPANEQAKIVNVRAEDFNETADLATLGQRGWLLIDALCRTLDDLWWSADGPDLAKIKTATQDFSKAYVAWAKEYLAQESRTIPTDNTLVRALFDHSKGNLAAIAQETFLTLDELRTLAKGNTLPIDQRNKLAELPDEVQAAHQEQRSKAVKTLCNELREGGFNEAERTRFMGLLENKEPDPPSETTVITSEIRKLRESLKENQDG